MLLLLTFATLIGISLQGSVENGVIGAPEVECMADNILVNFNTDQIFEGHVYVKGHYDSSGCRTDATLSKAASISVPFQACGVRRQRESSPKGIYVSVTVVISFHPMFITMVDRAYNIKCFYMEADKTVNQGFDVSLRPDQHSNLVVMVGGKEGEIYDKNGNLQHAAGAPDGVPRDPAGGINVGMLTTETISQHLEMPSCTYSVHQGGDSKGDRVKFATVGQLVYHQWSCSMQKPNMAGIFCMTVHSCSVENGQGKQVQLLDENGCAQDKYLLNNLRYEGDLVAGQDSMVFKFADNPSLFFQCQIRLSIKEGDVCKRTSDQCPTPTRGKRSVAIPVDDVTAPGDNVDVFSETFTIFDIDEHQEASDVALLNHKYARAVQDRKEAGVLDLSAPWSPAGTPVCLSSTAFGLLVSVLAIVLVVATVTMALLCLRRANLVAQLEKTGQLY